MLLLSCSAFVHSDALTKPKIIHSKLDAALFIPFMAATFQMISTCLAYHLNIHVRFLYSEIRALNRIGSNLILGICISIVRNKYG